MIYTVAIIGCGSRGVDAYGNYINQKKEQFKIISLCDTDEIKLRQAQRLYNVKEENIFINDKEFFKEKRADVLVLATQDRDHVWMGIRALELGYDILLEKPISENEAELYKLLEAQKKYNHNIIVCHVLRYAPAFLKVKELLNNNTIGKLIRIETIEQVGYWHQAHSFVRGNWRNSNDTSSMIMQKCCHDLDLIQYYVGDKCDTVYSTGDLAYFNRKNQPLGAADRCEDCKYINSCIYSAENVYVTRWKTIHNKQTTWPYNVVDKTRPITEDSLRKAYMNNQYGRCVFACDNNVVDNQMVDMKFANGVKCTLVMTAFTENTGRIMKFHGTNGEIELNEYTGIFRISIFGKSTQNIKISDIIKDEGKDSFGHGGGDGCLIDTLYDTISGKIHSKTSLEGSIESHLIAIAAEKSRKSGNIVRVHN